MAFFGKVIGNANEITTEALPDRFENMLAFNEEIRSGFKIIRDYIVFTNLRLIYSDHQGVTGMKCEDRSFPYRSLVSWSFETAGPTMANKTVRIWLYGIPKPYKLDFPPKYDLIELEVAFAEALSFSAPITSA